MIEVTAEHVMLNVPYLDPDVDRGAVGSVPAFWEFLIYPEKCGDSVTVACVPYDDIQYILSTKYEQQV
jgi:hypothetical protein